MARIWCLLAGLMVSMGCLVLPYSTPLQVFEGRRSGDMDLAFLQRGVTSRQEVLQRLGEPTCWLQAQRTLVYSARFSTGKLLLIAPYLWTSTTRHQREGFYVCFSADDRLLDWGGGKAALTDSWLTSASRWASERRLPWNQAGVPPGVRRPAPGGSLLIFYRPDPSTWLKADLLPSVAVDGTRFGQLRQATYLVVEVPAGDHTCLIAPDTLLAPSGDTPSHIRVVGALTLDLQPGAITFVEVRATAGVLRDEAKLRVVPEAEALTAIKPLREAW